MPSLARFHVGGEIALIGKMLRERPAAASSNELYWAAGLNLSTGFSFLPIIGRPTDVRSTNEVTSNGGPSRRW
ncbi:MAG: hypothetical protein ACTS68_00900 [Candidatus Hodgkinia cicadicola]